MESFADFLKEYNKKKTAKQSFAEFMAAYQKERAADESNDTAPVQEENERKWFQKGAFEDGYQFGDVIRTLLGSATDVRENVASGILGMGESALDALAWMGNAYAKGQYYANGGGYNLEADKLFEQQHQAATEWTKDFIQKDLYDEEKVAKAIISDPYKKITGIDAEAESVFGEKSDALVQSAGQLLGTAGLQAVGVPWFLTTGATAFGSEAENALHQGATFEQAGLSAAISAGAEILTEKLSGAIKFGGKAIDDGLSSLIAANISNKLVQKLAKLGVDMAGEGAEEVLSQVASNLGSALYKEENIGQLLFSEEAFDGYLESLVGGMVLGGGSSAVNAVKSADGGVDAVSGLTRNEQKVVDKVYKDEIAGKNLSAKEKARIYDEILQQMEKGYIDTETIEGVLGDRSAYDSLVKESEEFDKLYNTPGGQLSKAQQDRLAQLEEKNKKSPYKALLEAEKGKFSQGVQDMVKGSRLAESYAERGRRGEKFQADVSQYAENQRATVQAAIDSGILNNTNRSHEFVDFVAKLAADKGVAFDFTNNEKLKETGFALEGVTVNGFVNEKGVTVNVQSAKALNAVVGHEITHVLEGTQLYDALVQTITEYAKAKGEYQSRYDSLAKLYEGVENANVEAEVVADLVGDYLFTDKAFVQKLSAENRNVFQKIFDEIKYLCKVVTAGSKEAKQLLEVKKAFEEAYRAETKNTVVEDGVRYALASNENITPSKEQLLGNAKAVTEMESVCEISADNLMDTGKDIKEIYAEHFSEWGNNIHSDVFGDIAVKRSSIGSEFAHGNTAEKIAAIEAIPSVIEHGKIIDWFEKSKGLFRITVAAPIKIGGTPYYMGVMLQRDSQNQRLYIHDVILEKEASASTQEHLSTKGPYSGNKNLSISSILRKALVVNPQYLEAVQNGDMKTAQKLVDQAAQDAGYTVKAYHGSGEKFNTFSYGHIGSATGVGILGDGFYFSDTKPLAKMYGREMYAVRLKMENTYHATEPDQYKINTEELIKHGYDSVDMTLPGGGKIYCVFDNTQMKSAEAVTYDDNGNVIPLSERFNPEKTDIRYSLSEEAQADDIAPLPWQVRGQDVALFPTPEDIAAIENAKAVSKMENTTEAVVNPDDSTGAAPSGFDPVSHLQYEYGSLPEGEHPVREDSLPKSTNGKDRVSLTARTAKGAEATPDELVDLLDKETVGGRFSYLPIKNSETVRAAYNDIVKKGWEAARGEWEAKVRRGEVSAELSAKGALLLNNAAKAGDKKAWLDILHDYQIMGTNAGQAIQAMRILKTLTPDDSLHMIERSVDQMVEDMKLGAKIVIDENLKQQYRDAKTDGERDTARKALAEDIARQIPSTAADKWTALRYLNMLGNLRTQGRNILGNAGMQVVSGVKNTIATALENIAYAVTGGKFHKTKSLAVNKGMLKAAKADFQNMEAMALSGGKFSDSAAESLQFAQEVQNARKIFKFAPLEWYRKGTNWAMDKGDLVFSRAAYARALAGYLKAQGITETDFSKIDPQVLDEARAYAVKQAQEQTFRDSNWLSDWVSKMGRWKDTPAVGKALSEGIMPFRKTPANILIRAEEYSPLGLVNATVKSIQAAKGKATGAEVVNSWAKALTGTGLFGLGMLLNSIGALSGGPDEDDDKEWFEDQYGWQNYAVQIGDVNFTIDFLSPEAMPLLMGAQLMEMMQDGGIELKEIESALLSIADPMIEMSMLQGVNDTLENIQYAESNMGQFVVNACLSYLTQGLTNSFLGQVERSFEGQRMSTYVDKDSDLPDWLQKALGKASAKTPIWEYNQIPYINAWGEEEESNPLFAALENMLSPAYVEQGKTDAVYEELNRLNDAQSDINVYPQTPDKTLTFEDADGVRHEDYNLSKDEYVELAKLQGQTQKRLVEGIISSKVYGELTDREKAKAIQLAYQYARDYSRQQVLDADGFSSKWMAEAGDDIVEAIIAHTNDERTFAYDYPEKYALAQAVGGYDSYMGYRDALGDIKSDKDKDGNTISGSRKQKVVDYINGLDAEYGEKIILYVSAYPSKESRAAYGAEIVDYLSCREDLSYQDIVAILTELGFTVRDDGWVTWD